VIDYSASNLPKVNRHVQTKAMRDALRKKIDRQENAKVKERSGGQCEVWFPTASDSPSLVRCDSIATEVHHMISGRGNRARGPSLLAEHKQHCCAWHHAMITAKKLQRVGGEAPHYTDTYRRVK